MVSTELMALLSTLVLLATISTTIFAVAAYVVSRGYLKRKPNVKNPLAGAAPAAAEAGNGASASGHILKRYDPYGVSRKH